MAHSQFIIPKNSRDRTLFSIMAILIPLAVIWEFGVVLPYYHKSLSCIVICHMLAAAYIVMSIIGNILLVIRTDPSGRRSFLPSVQKPDWKYCYPCKLNSPPRSYHCRICEECVLRRDHHCSFLGCCIGYHNHRYYIVAISYSLIGTLYAVIFQFEYCFNQMGGFTVSTILSMVAPHFALILGYISLYGCFVSIVQIIGFILIFMTSYLVVTQFRAMINGQTRYENSHHIVMYDLGWKNNIVDVLGKNWWLTWLFPTVPSPLLGDGQKFVKTHEYEDVKNM